MKPVKTLLYHAQHSFLSRHKQLAVFVLPEKSVTSWRSDILQKHKVAIWNDRTICGKRGWRMEICNVFPSFRSTVEVSFRDIPSPSKLLHQSSLTASVCIWNPMSERRGGFFKEQDPFRFRCTTECNTTIVWKCMFLSLYNSLHLTLHYNASVMPPPQTGRSTSSLRSGPMI